MNITDFLIGFFLMNAMPHFILGHWGTRMLSGFGFGNKANLAWALANLVTSLTIMIYTYGLSGILDHGIYLGALSMLILFWIASPLWKKLFGERN
ncbi:MAG: hypothetical protein COA58_05890 [Bacteroidetes bacterium]|nr:MAG: hypothetical protein COA58_05890 [Bacteroidota bacterium]